MATPSWIPRRRTTAPVVAMRRCLSTVQPGLPQRQQQLRSLFPVSKGAEVVPEERAPRRARRLQRGQRQRLSEVWFSATFPRRDIGLPEQDHKPPDERKIKLGKTLRILQERLPTLLQYPLPSEILSPTISLHLFPSTHPHLPVVSGRVAYVAALWTSPLAWNRVPIVGNVRLEILSERMSKQPLLTSPRRAGAGDEELVVRWRTIGAASAGGRGKGKGSGSGSNSGSDKTTAATATATPAARAEGADTVMGTETATATATTTTTTTVTPTKKPTTANSGATTDTNAAKNKPLVAGSPTKEFTGLFIFEFDQEGRILSHTIEHVEEGGDWERSVGARFVGLTDWLLGGMRGGSPPPVAAFEMQQPHKLR